MKQGFARVVVSSVLLCSAAAAQTQVYSIPGSESGERYGTSVDVGGDADGDGRPDLLVGAPYATATGGGATKVGRYELRSGANGTLLHGGEGAAEGDVLGTAVAFVGDLTGDGLSELVIGAPQTSAAALGPGYVRFVSGSTGASSGPYYGGAGGTAFGASVAPAGDVDGDGVPDVVVGAPGTGSPFTGYAHVIAGGTGGIVHTLLGDLPGATWGIAVTGVGDWDLDGFADQAVGGQGSVGRARVFSGDDGATLGTWNYQPCPIPSCLGENPYFGWSVAGPGDVDLDGRVDLLVGAPNYGIPATGYAGAGFVDVYSSATGTLSKHYQGKAGFDAFGDSIAPAGDVDGDGAADFLVGAPAHHPVEFTLPYVRLYSGAKGTVLLEHDTGSGVDDDLGDSVAAGADLVGDGQLDLVIGVSRAGFQSTGELLVLSSEPLPLAADLHELSLAAGGAQAFSLDAGASHGGELYLLLGSLSGITPGIPADGHVLPLNPDAYFTFSLSNAGGPVLPGSVGALDGTGAGAAQLVVPPGSVPSLAGATAHHAYAVLGTAEVTLTSNPVPLLLGP